MLSACSHVPLSRDAFLNTHLFLYSLLISYRLQPIVFFIFFSDSDKDDKESFTITEYILIACLGAFVFVLIAIIFLVVQITRLNKSVRNLKATSNR